MPKTSSAKAASTKKASSKSKTPAQALKISTPPKAPLKKQSPNVPALPSNARSAPKKAVSEALPSAKSKRGGVRAGAGRPTGSGKLGDTICLRVPRRIIGPIKKMRDELVDGKKDGKKAKNSIGLRLFDMPASAGFGVPSDDGSSRRVDLYTLFSPKPECTFLVKVSGMSMRDAGIHDGDYLVIDRSIDARSGHVVVAHIEGQGLVAKRLRIDATGSFLDSENPEFGPIKLSEETGTKIWGVARAKAGLLI